MEETKKEVSLIYQKQKKMRAETTKQFGVEVTMDYNEMNALLSALKSARILKGLNEDDRLAIEELMDKIEEAE